MTKFTRLLEIIANVVYWCGRNASLSITTVYQIYQHQNVVQIQLLLAYKFFTWEITTVMVSNKDILHTAGWSRNVQSFTAYGWYMGSCLSYFFSTSSKYLFLRHYHIHFFFLGTTEIFFHSFLLNGIVQSIPDPMVPSYAGRLVILSCFRNCGFWTHHLFNKVCSNPYHV